MQNDELINKSSTLRSAARLERSSFFADAEVSVELNSEAKNSGSGRRKSCH